MPSIGFHAIKPMPLFNDRATMAAGKTSAGSFSSCLTLFPKTAHELIHELIHEQFFQLMK